VLIDLSVSSCPRQIALGSKNDDGRREWSATLGLPESEASANQPDLAPHCEVVPPPGVGPGRDKADDSCSFEGCRVGFRHPNREGGTIRWVHPTDSPPGLRQAVLLRRKEMPALCILRGCTNVDLEAELRVEIAEHVRWCFPVMAIRAKESLVKHILGIHFKAHRPLFRGHANIVRISPSSKSSRRHRGWDQTGRSVGNSTFAPDS
jgi:hypothetical protein